METSMKVLGYQFIQILRWGENMVHYLGDRTTELIYLHIFSFDNTFLLPNAVSFPSKQHWDALEFYAPEVGINRGGLNFCSITMVEADSPVTRRPPT